MYTYTRIFQAFYYDGKPYENATEPRGTRNGCHIPMGRAIHGCWVWLPGSFYLFDIHQILLDSFGVPVVVRI